MCPFKSLINITTVSASTTTPGRGSYKDPGSFMLLLNPKISLPTNSWPCYWKGHAPWNIHTSDQTSVTFWHLVAAGNRLASNQSWDSFSGRILFTFLVLHLVPCYLWNRRWRFVSGRAACVSLVLSVRTQPRALGSILSVPPACSLDQCCPCKVCVLLEVIRDRMLLASCCCAHTLVYKAASAEPTTSSALLPVW